MQDGQVQAKPRSDYKAKMLTPGLASVWCTGAKQQFVGTVKVSGYTFESDASKPLTFVVDKDKGFYYSPGKGKVTDPQGKVTTQQVLPRLAPPILGKVRLGRACQRRGWTRASSWTAAGSSVPGSPSQVTCPVRYGVPARSSTPEHERGLSQSDQGCMQARGHCAEAHGMRTHIGQDHVY